jgi:hypothetical protein
MHPISPRVAALVAVLAVLGPRPAAAALAPRPVRTAATPLLTTASAVGTARTAVARRAPRQPTAAPALRVSGNRLVDPAGRTVQLRGVNRSSPEVLCQATGRTSYFLGPVDAASVSAIRAWGANTVRLPVNEDCWLGRLGLPVSGSAAAYRAELVSYARLLVAGGLHVVLDVHFAETAPYGVALPSVGPAPMLDKAYGPTLWRQLATTFKDDPAVLFDLYNEPHSITWQCWRDGCGTYAGMQELVTAVRETGARNPLVLTGPSWGNELTRWLAYRPHDPLGNLVAGVHVYPESGCASQACLDERVRPVAERAPVVIGEFGTTECGGTFLRTLPAWADRYGIGYLAFTWNTPPKDCAGYHLVTDFLGAPTRAGAVFRDHLLARAGLGKTALSR